MNVVESTEFASSIAPDERERESERADALVVVGAGAAGLLAAIFAARAGARVVLLESTSRPGAKIRISGGGRCNILPSTFELADFHSAGSTNALRRWFASWPLAEIRRFFEVELAVPLVVERETGKLFPASDRAQDVVDALLGECARLGVELVADARVERVRLDASADVRRFLLAASGGREYRARSVVLATGGLSVPKTGSDGRGLEIARELGHTLVPNYPALVPLETDDAELRELAGVTIRASICARRSGKLLEERIGPVLFTHRGFSGPTVLDLSYHVARADSEDVELRVRWIGERDGDWDAELRAGGKKTVAGILHERLPRRLASILLRRADVDAATKASELSRDARKSLIAELEEFRLPVVGNEGYRTAEVTGGGIALEELSTKTLESRRVAGLYACGEMVDVTGRIGGFNFLWAWISGRLAGTAAAKAVRVDA